MQPIDPSATVASLVLSHPAAARMFERFNIDFCCRGRVPLAEACRELGLDLHEVMTDLAQELRRSAPTLPPSRDTAALINHLLEHHHSFARDELERLMPLAAKVERAHAERHQELRQVRELIKAVADDLLPHMRKEELVLFPLLRAQVEHGRPGPAPRGPIAVMEREHDELGNLLKQLRELTSGYTPPSDACTSYRVLYTGLERLSGDLHQHIHLENNVLFPLAVALEQMPEAPPSGHRRSL